MSARRRFFWQLAGWALVRRGYPAALGTGTTVGSVSADLERALARELGTTSPTPSTEIGLTVPAVAEDGAVVPVLMQSRIEGTDRLVLLAERNPFPLLAAFDFAPPAEPFVSLRVKLNASGQVVALARVKGRYFITQQAVRVVVGGCG